MSNSKSTDHWNVLARLLGTAPADAEIPANADDEALAQAPEEKVEIPETPPSAEPFWENPSAEGVSEPGPTTEVAAVVEPVRTEISVPTKPAPKAAPTSKPSKPKANHWRELASSLGIEVTEPEPEPEPEPEAAPVIAEIDNRMVRQSPSIPTRAPEYKEREEHGPRIKTTDQEPTRTPRAERGFDTEVRTRSEPRQGSRRASLFEDPDLSLDTPGVLDSIFDEIEPETGADSPPAVDQQPEEIREVRGDRRERAEKFGPRERERDLVFVDEPAEEEVEEVEAVATERVELETPRDADEEDRPGRRRKRRRRRGGRRDQKLAAEETQGEAAEEGFEEDEERIERRSDATDIRERRPVAPSEELEDLEEEADDHLEDDEEDEEGGSDRLRLKHKKIPTWEQAIDAIVAVNMESRAKNPGGGAGRGRGRRWRR